MKINKLVLKEWLKLEKLMKSPIDPKRSFYYGVLFAISDLMKEPGDNVPINEIIEELDKYLVGNRG